MSAPIDCDPDAIAQLARAGDVAALDRMTRCFGDRLYEVGKRTCRCAADADDAVQDAMLSAGLHLRDYRGDGSLEGWLVRMVANACARMRRGGKNAPHDEVDPALPAAEDTPEMEAARGEVMHRIGEVLLELQPRDRAIVVLADAEDWTAPEIAERLGMTAEAVRARLSRAHKALRVKLSVTDPSDDASGEI